MNHDLVGCRQMTSGIGLKCEIERRVRDKETKLDFIQSHHFWLRNTANKFQSFFSSFTENNFQLFWVSSFSGTLSTILLNVPFNFNGFSVDCSDLLIFRLFQIGYIVWEWVDWRVASISHSFVLINGQLNEPKCLWCASNFGFKVEMPNRLTVNSPALWLCYWLLLQDIISFNGIKWNRYGKHMCVYQF